jgi:hypothetical protein
MPQNYVVEYSTTGAALSWTEIDNVQDIAMTIGRQRQLDAYNASQATITVRYPTGYASPITEIVSGTFIQITNATTGAFMFTGVINNVDVTYGIPFAGGVGNADFLFITVEGKFAQFGRAQGLNYAMTADTLSNQIANCATESNLGISVNGTQTRPMAATSVSSTWGDWVNKVLVTINGRLWDAIDVASMTVRTPNQSYPTTVNFSDTTNNATNQVYDQINFGSYADNFYTQVTVDPESFGEATVQTGTAPYRTLLTNTFNASTSQATDYANYLLANYDSQSFALLSISCLAEAQNTFKLDSLAGTTYLASYPGISCTVTFRGTVFNCVIEGASVTATPESSRYTFYLSGADLNAYLVLNDAVFGKLDNNKLGY